MRDVCCHLRPAGQRDRHRHFALSALPNLGRRLARFSPRHVTLGTRQWHKPVVAPAQRDVQRMGRSGYQEGQADGRREEALLGRTAILIGLLVEARLLGDRLRLIVLVGVAALLGRRARGDEEAGQVPVGGPQGVGELLSGEGVSGGWADQVELQRLDKLGANGEGWGWVGHQVSCAAWRR